MSFQKCTVSTGLEALYRETEGCQYTCPEGCCKCCGPVPMSKQEAEILGLSGRLYTLGKGEFGDTCEFVDEKTGKCTVYENRPFICRFFNGASEGCFKCEEIRDSGKIDPIKHLLLVGKYCNLIAQEDGFVDGYLDAADKCYDAMTRREIRNGWRKKKT